MKTGIDITKVDRFVREIKDQHFLKRIFTQREILHIFEHNTEQGRLERLAGKFSAKEAVSKAMGVGIANGINFIDIEILPNEFGAPTVTLHNGAREKFINLCYEQIEVSISHDEDYATAVCIIL